MNIVLSLCEKSRSTYPKKPCLENLFEIFINHNIYILGDDLSEEMMEYLKSYKVIVENKIRGKDKYMVDKYNFCINNFSPEDIIYIVEDDYMHKPGSDILIEEGLEHADYVTLYDHPDKYSYSEIPINPEIEGVGEQTIVFLTKNSHWKYTNSTTGTYAFKKQTMIEDYDVWMNEVINNIWGYDYGGFIQLRNKNRKVASCIPGFSSHMGHPAYLSPFFYR